MNAELGRRIAFTLCALLIFRIGTYIPLPGIDIVSARSQSGGIPGTLHSLSIFALSIFPYITAAVLLQLLRMVGSRTLRGLSKAGEHGRRVVYEYTRYLAVLLTAVQAYGASRTTVLGASYLALAFLIPELMIAYAHVPFYFGGSSVLIVVCVVLDISAQVRRDGLLNMGGSA